MGRGMTRDLDAFAGSYEIAREIEDRAGDGAMRFSGRLDLLEDGTGLCWHETGRLDLPGGQVLVAERRYLWRAGGGGLVDVLFEDGRYFHSFDPGELRPQAGHDCAPDRYDVAYDFTGWPNFAAHWRVTGPRKDYDSRSTYTRLPG